MSTKELLKAEIDSLPENILEKVREFIAFQKFLEGAYENDTEYLSSIPGMKESIVEGGKTPLSECSKELE